MILSKLYQALTHGVATYFRETSVHGFRYVVESRGKGFRIFWTFAIVFAVSLCGFLISQTLDEMARNPTLTTTEEVSIDEVPAPAVSILVPQIFSQRSLNKKVLNQFDACDPTVDFRTNELLAPFLALNVAFNDMARKRLSNISSFNVTILETFEHPGKMEAFCAFANKMKSFEFDFFAAEEYSQKVIDLVDADFMVNDYLEIIKKSLDSSNELNTDCADIDDFTLETVLQDWMPTMAPVDFNIENGYACSEKFSSGLGNFLIEVFRFFFLESYDNEFLLTSDETQKIIDVLNKIRPGPPHDKLELTKLNLLQLFKPFRYQIDLKSDFVVTHVCGDVSEFSDYFLSQIEDGFGCPTNGSSKELACCEKMLRFWHNVPYAETLASAMQDRHQEFLMETKPEPKIALEPFVESCQIWNGNLKLDCTLDFQAMPSLSGVVYSFNIPRAKDTFKKELRGNIFEQWTDHETKEAIEIPDGRFILSLRLMPKYTEENIPIESFQLSIHDRTEPPDFRANSIILGLGVEHVIKLKAKVRMADKSLKTMDLNARKCLFEDDNDRLTLFRNYSRSACLFECIKEKIQMECNCIPWDYPRSPVDVNMQPCYSTNMACPKSFLDANLEEGCDCPLDCNHVKYSTVLSSKHWDAESELCNFMSLDDRDNMLELLASWADLSLALRSPYTIEESAFLEKEFRAYDFCLNKAGGGLKITISYEDSIGERSVKIGRVSFAGILSNLGGTIGLFTGMSILSLIEIGYWLAIMAGKIFKVLCPFCVSPMARRQKFNKRDLENGKMAFKA